MNILPLLGANNMNQPQVPIPNLGRMMVFIDGENLVHRFTSMKNAGRTPRDKIHYEKDIYVWSEKTTNRSSLNQIIRATYYTYAFGDSNRIEEIKNQIKSLRYENYSDPWARDATRLLLRNIYPCVFKKEKSKQAKGVDIQLTVDVLTNVYLDNLDSIFLVSGDGDYKPVIQEAIRHGKHVFVAALSSGLNSELKYLADMFIDLDVYYFEPEK